MTSRCAERAFSDSDVQYHRDVLRYRARPAIPALLPAGGSLPLCDDVATSVVPRSVQAGFPAQTGEYLRQSALQGVPRNPVSLWTVAGHMLGGVIQPANKGDTRVDHHNFAMHPAKHIGAHTKKARAGIVVAKYHASCRQFIDKLIAEIGEP